MSFLKLDIEKIIHALAPSLEGTYWVIGGSAALVLQGIFYEANDIDIVQHSGNRVVLEGEYEERLWSRSYGEIDLHYSNPFAIEDYPDQFLNIIAAIDYIDFVHSSPYKTWNVVSPRGAGLINWVHHFLEYGFDPSRTLVPTGADKDALMDILSPEIYGTIEWKVQRERVDKPKISLDFENHIKNFGKRRGKGLTFPKDVV